MMLEVLYLAAKEHRLNLPMFHFTYNDIEKKFLPDICCDMLDVDFYLRYFLEIVQCGNYSFIH